MGDVELSMSLPLDRDGFLRRECPACEREFKWRPTPEGEEGVPAPAGYHCPYCARTASADQWWTKGQVEAAEWQVYIEVLKPTLDRLGDGLRGKSDGLVQISTSIEWPERPPPLEEPDDMRRIDFVCHSTEPVKVALRWEGPVSCLICGALASAAEAPRSDG